jgi:hypothetical protein
VAADERLTATDKLCLGYLNYCSANKNRCDVFCETIAGALGIDIKTANRAVKRLKAAGFIRARRNGLNRPNTYFLLPDPAIEGTRKQRESEPDWQRRTMEAGAKERGAAKKPAIPPPTVPGTEGTFSPHAEGANCPFTIRSTRSSSQEAAAGGVKALRAALARNDIPVRDNRPDVRSELEQMVEIARCLGASDRLTEFVAFKAEQKKQQGDPIGSTKFALMCVQRDFPDWLNRQRPATPAKQPASWTPPPRLTEEESRRMSPHLWAELDAEREAREKKAS